MIVEMIKQVASGREMTEEQAYSVMDEIMDGMATPAQIASILTALSMKGETLNEITGFAKSMRRHATVINVDDDCIDTCGTGGDHSGTFNISTVSAFVVAGAGVKVAKHGNRGITSKCGSADLLKTAGVNIEASPKKVEKCVNEVGIGFLFAPLLHSAMKHAIGVRREIGIRTVFNILGPMTNPAGAKYQVVGVFDSKMARILSEALKNLGSKRAMVVHSEDGLDEISISANTSVCELKRNEIHEYSVSPANFGVNKATLGDIKGGSAEENHVVMLDILNGVRGPKMDVVVMNSSAALVVAGKAGDFYEGIQMAKDSIFSGKAIKKLQDLIAVSNEKD